MPQDGLTSRDVSIMTVRVVPVSKATDTVLPTFTRFSWEIWLSFPIKANIGGFGIVVNR